MTELLTAAQMKAIEQAAIKRGEVTGLELMERAGRGVVEAVFEEWPELAKTSHKAVVLCGPGNNGGDGFVVARLLKEWGWEVEVFFYGEVEKLPPDARMNYERWGEVGETKTWCLDAFERLRGVPLLVDAVFGTGLTRPLPDEVNEGFGILRGRLRKPWSRRFRRCVAVDFPSGVASDTGKMMDGDKGYWLQAALCVTFSFEKVGHHLANGPFHSKKLAKKPLSLRREEFLERGPFNEPKEDRRVSLLDQKLFGRGTPFLRALLQKDPSWHKYWCGHALILTGGPGKTGAARLSARGALRIGAGVVTLGVPPSAQMEVAGHITALMLTRVTDGDALGEVLQDTRINALCLGPGLGLERARESVPVAVRAEHTPYVVLDADALSAYGDDPAALFAILHDGCVLTPHGGEFARLFPDIAKRLRQEPRSGPAYSKVDATRDAAKRAGCTVLFKGADTVIAAPDGRCSINSAHYERAAPWLATAGSGDVLSGFITGLMARGFAPFQAAETAAWLHVECALEFGPGLIAEDIPEVLPKVLRRLGL
ncbi:MAG: NAD(P)H-hydrate dehydratase [Rhodobacteraceae bacterium]|nr:NAD(P)H-hydrate dehydratase [Paracoccaceae bacterium]